MYLQYLFIYFILGARKITAFLPSIFLHLLQRRMKILNKMLLFIMQNILQRINRIYFMDGGDKSKWKMSATLSESELFIKEVM